MSNKFLKGYCNLKNNVLLWGELTKVREILSGYKLEIKKFPKKEKRTYGGLTIAVMQAFIIQCEDTIEKADIGTMLERMLKLWF